MSDTLKGDAVARISRLHEMANRFIILELGKRGIHGIVPSHGDILFILFRDGRLPMQEIARKIHRTKPTVTILVKKLVELGYVYREKSQDDNRVFFIGLTGEGKSLRPAFDEISALLKDRMYGGLTPGQGILFEEMLGMVLERFVLDGTGEHEADQS
jgi:DNA-binding MarR family transcriptional regulator